jgi:hypothetical protein
MAQLGYYATPLLKKWNSQVPVAHACNPSYLGDRDQKDHGWMPAQANSSRDPILKKTHYKKGLVECIKVWPWVQAQ